MKTIKYFTATILLSTLTLGCNKIEHEKTEYTIEGRLMYNCDTPASNVEDIYLSQTPDGINLGKKPLHFTFNTDQDGYFKATYEGSKANGSDFELGKTGRIMEGIPRKKNINIGNVYWQAPSFSYIRRLEVIKPYSINDTLIIPDHNNQNNLFKYLPGPFSNGIIDTVWNHIPLGIFPARYNSIPKFSPYYRLATEHNWRESSIILNDLCFQGIYDVVLVLD